MKQLLVPFSFYHSLVVRFQEPHQDLAWQAH